MLKLSVSELSDKYEEKSNENERSLKRVESFLPSISSPNRVNIYDLDFSQKNSAKARYSIKNGSKRNTNQYKSIGQALFDVKKLMGTEKLNSENIRSHKIVGFNADN